MPSTTVPVSSTSAMSPVARVANQSGLVAVATAAVGITAAGSRAAAGGRRRRPGRDPEDDETPMRRTCRAEVPRGRRSSGRGRAVDRQVRQHAVKCANLAPMTAAAAADSRPTRQVIFLTRRRPSSRASAALEYWVRVTASGSPVILCDEADALLRNVRISIAQPM